MVQFSFKNDTTLLQTWFKSGKKIWLFQLCFSLKLITQSTKWFIAQSRNKISLTFSGKIKNENCVLHRSNFHQALYWLKFSRLLTLSRSLCKTPQNPEKSKAKCVFTVSRGQCRLHNPNVNYCQKNMPACNSRSLKISLYNVLHGVSAIT